MRRSVGFSIGLAVLVVLSTICVVALARRNFNLAIPAFLLGITVLVVLTLAWIAVRFRLRDQFREESKFVDSINLANQGRCDEAIALLDSLEVVSRNRRYAARVNRLRAEMKLYVARKLIEQESYDRAAALLESLEKGLLVNEKEVMRDNALAYCLAKSGQADRAVDIAREMIGRASKSLLPYCHGTLGIALVLANRPQQAITELEVALTTGAEDAEAQAIRAFYAGEALRMLGKMDEAAAAYEWACAEAPESQGAVLARTQLEALKRGTPYR